MGACLLSSAERGVALTQEGFPAVNTSVAGAAAVFEGQSQQICGWHTVTLPPVRRFPSAWSPASKPSLSSALMGGPPTRALQRSQMHTSTQLNTCLASTSFRKSSSRHTWNTRLASSSKLMALSHKRTKRTKKLLPPPQPQQQRQQLHTGSRGGGGAGGCGHQSSLQS
jgi:hypothetical protein